MAGAPDAVRGGDGATRVGRTGPRAEHADVAGGQGASRPQAVARLNPTMADDTTAGADTASLLLACAAVSVAAFAVYRATLLPGVDLGDTGGFQAAVSWPSV